VSDTFVFPDITEAGNPHLTARADETEQEKKCDAIETDLGKYEFAIER
jgi:hypothetical protein